MAEDGAAALAFLAAEALGVWSRSSVNRAPARATQRAGRPAFTTFQIRHSFAGRVAPSQHRCCGTPGFVSTYPAREDHDRRGGAGEASALEPLRGTDENGAPFPAGKPVSLARTAGRAAQGTRKILWIQGLQDA